MSNETKGYFQQNSAILVANLVVKPTIKTVNTAKGESQVANVRAINHQGEKQLEVEISAWGKQAEKLAKADKGFEVKVVGIITNTRTSYESDGSTKTSHKINFNAKVVESIKAPRIRNEEKTQLSLEEALRL